MNLPLETTIYGFTFELNISIQCGMDWTGKAPAYVHCCLVGLGDDQAKAEAEAQNIVAKFGREQYKFNFIAKPKMAYFSEEI